MRLSLASALVVAVAAWAVARVAALAEVPALVAVVASAAVATVVDPLWAAAPRSSSPTYVHHYD